MRTTSFLLCVFLLSLFACSKKPETNDQRANPASAVIKVDPAKATTISGVIKLEGTPPKPQKIDMAQDPACGNQPNYDESFVVNHGNLANVFVYVKSPSGPVTGVTHAAAIIEQRGCRYYPHVMGTMAGEPVRIVNVDDTTHNIHPMPAQNKQWNESQLPKAEPIIKTFNQPEIMIPIKCNQHPWMKMYLNVVDNPWFAVSDEEGKFEITGLPPGEYTIAAVHEKLGEQTMKISVGPKESKKADFAFKAQ